MKLQSIIECCTYRQEWVRKLDSWRNIYERMAEECSLFHWLEERLFSLVYQWEKQKQKIDEYNMVDF